MPTVAVERAVECHCKALMRLKPSPYRDGFVYECSRPKCGASILAHDDGRPASDVADANTRRWRIKAHEAFDSLWKGRTGRSSVIGRRNAYIWLQDVLEIPTSDQAHIGKLSAQQCQVLILKINELKKGK